MPVRPLTEEIVRSFIQYPGPFPVDFDEAWRWLGYSRKAAAKTKLLNNFEEGFDFSTDRCENPARGRPKELIRISIDCFKQLAMMAETSKGKEVRRYYLEIERKWQKPQINDPLLPSPPPGMTMEEYALWSAQQLARNSRQRQKQEAALQEHTDILLDHEYRLRQAEEVLHHREHTPIQGGNVKVSIT